MGKGKEIVVTGITRLDLEHPDMWASISITRQAWIRQVAPQLEIDVRKQILGEALISIIGDDANVFGIGFLSKELAKEGRNSLNIRLENEINTPELPGDIRNRLEQVRGSVNEIDWESKEGFEAAKREWFTTRDWVEERISGCRKLKEAERYARQQSRILSPYWSEFIYGKDPFNRWFFDKIM